MSCTPLPPGANQFVCLPVGSSNISLPVNDSLVETVSAPSDVQNTPLVKASAETSPPPSSVQRPRVPAWERRLPCRYVVASTPSSNSLRLHVEIETTDTQ